MKVYPRFMLPDIDMGVEVFVRTDFSDDDAWDEVCDAIESSEFDLESEFVDDSQYSNLNPNEIRRFVPEGFGGSAVYVVDSKSVSSDTYSLLVVGLRDMAERQFRASIECLHLVCGLLNRGNKGFVEFIDACDDDGVFRDETKLEVFD